MSPSYTRTLASIVLSLAFAPSALSQIGPGNAIRLTVSDGDECRRAASHWNLSAFTIEAWINLNDLTVNSFGRAGGIVTYGSTSKSPYALWIHAGAPSNPITNGKLAVQVNQNIGSSTFLVSAAPVPINQWVHVAGTYDGVGTVATYINGQLSSSGAYALPIGSLTAGTMSVGNNFPGVVEYFGGDIDEVRIWDYARSEAQLQETMGVSLCGDEPGLFAYWKFDEVPGAQTIIDHSGNSRSLDLGTSGGVQTSDPLQTASTAPISTPDINGNQIPDACEPPALCPGDVDGDNDTDAFDFGVFAPNFGTAGHPPFTNGDLDGDGDIDAFDFAIFAPDFGCPN